jgi:hypothetical protein
MVALNVRHGRMNEPGGRLASPEQGLSCAQNRLGETCTSHRLPETCHGVPVELDSSRVACLRLLQVVRRVNHVSREKVVHRGRRNDGVRGLPSVKLVRRQLLMRVACVGHGRQPQKQRESLSDLSGRLRVA